MFASSLSRRPSKALGEYNAHAMNKPRSLLLMLCALCLVLPLTLLMTHASANTATPVKPLLVATNQGDRDLSIIDPVAAKQLATVPEGGITGHEVATSPEGSPLTCRSTAARASVSRAPTAGRWW